MILQSEVYGKSLDDENELGPRMGKAGGGGNVNSPFCDMKLEKSWLLSFLLFLPLPQTLLANLLTDLVAFTATSLKLLEPTLLLRRPEAEYPKLGLDFDLPLLWNPVQGGPISAKNWSGMRPSGNAEPTAWFFLGFILAVGGLSAFSVGAKTFCA